MQPLDFNSLVSGQAPPGWSFHDAYSIDFIVTDNRDVQQRMDHERAATEFGGRHAGRLAFAQKNSVHHLDIGFTEGWQDILRDAGFRNGRTDRARVLIKDAMGQIEPLRRLVWKMAERQHVLPLQDTPCVLTAETFPAPGRESAPPDFSVKAEIRIARRATLVDVGRHWTVSYDNTARGWTVVSSPSPARSLSDALDEIQGQSAKYLPFNEEVPA